MSDLHITIELYHQLERRVDEAEQKLSLAKAEYDQAQQLHQQEQSYKQTVHQQLLEHLGELQAEEPQLYREVQKGNPQGTQQDPVRAWQNTMDAIKAIKRALYMPV